MPCAQTRPAGRSALVPPGIPGHALPLLRLVQVSPLLVARMCLAGCQVMVQMTRWCTPHYFNVHSRISSATHVMKRLLRCEYHDDRDWSSGYQTMVQMSEPWATLLLPTAFENCISRTATPAIWTSQCLLLRVAQSATGWRNLQFITAIVSCTLVI